jgi:hypothetical protein
VSGPRLTALAVLAVGAALGAGGELLATRVVARSPHGGVRTVPVICANTGAQRCYQGARHVKRPYVDDTCWVDPEGGQAFIWQRLTYARPTASIFVCAPTI